MIKWMMSAGPTIVNMADMAAVALDRLRAQARDQPLDADLARLVSGFEAELGPLPPASNDVVVCPTFRVDDEVVSMIGMAGRFEAPMDVTVAELRVELFFPADPASKAFFERSGPLPSRAEVAP